VACHEVQSPDRPRNGQPVFPAASANASDWPARCSAGPSWVVLDEPNANLDGDGDRALADAIQMLRNQRVTIVIINHRPNLLSLAQPMTDAIRRGMRED
jgi:hypothetical protein